MTRSVKELLDHNVPYSEMTDEEIEAMVQYKATVISNSALHRERIDTHREYQDAMAKYSMQVAADAMAYTQELADRLMSHGSVE